MFLNARISQFLILKDFSGQAGTGFDWGGVNFLHSSPYGVVLYVVTNC